MRDEAKILLGLMALGECFDKKLSEAVQEIYLNALSGFEDAEIIAAINRAGMECKFFPRPAELIELIQGSLPSKKDAAALAWSKLVRAIEYQGSYKSVVFNDVTKRQTWREKLWIHFAERRTIKNVIHVLWRHVLAKRLVPSLGSFCSCSVHSAVYLY